jgi:hypothetical protein
LLCCCVSIASGGTTEDCHERGLTTAAAAPALPLLLLLAATGEGFLYAARSALLFREVFVERAIIRSLRLETPMGAILLLLLSWDVVVSVYNAAAFDLGDATGVVVVFVALLLLAQLRCRRERSRRTCRELFTIVVLFLLFLSICLIRLLLLQVPVVGCLLYFPAPKKR